MTAARLFLQGKIPPAFYLHFHNGWLVKHIGILWIKIGILWIKDVIYLIDEVFQNSYDDMGDLEEVSISISDRDYYVNSNK